MNVIVFCFVCMKIHLWVGQLSTLQCQQMVTPLDHEIGGMSGDTHSSVPKELQLQYLL